MRKALLTAVAIAALTAGAAQAQTLGYVINEGSQTVSIPTIGNVTFENKIGEQGDGTGSTAVTSLRGRGAAGTTGSNGSLEVRGDRSRYAIGNLYETVSSGGPQSPALLRLDDISSFSFEWAVSTVSSNPAGDHHAPAARIHIMDNGIRSELIWEHVYNGGASGVAVPTNVWSTADQDDRFYLNIRDNDGAAFLAQNAGQGFSIEANASQGVLFKNNAHFFDTFAGLNSLFSSNAYVTGFSFGAGSGATAAFVGHVDNLRIGVGNATVVANFEVAEAAVPEPATWAMMLAGFGLVGGAMRRRAGTLAAA